MNQINFDTPLLNPQNKAWRRRRPLNIDSIDWKIPSQDTSNITPGNINTPTLHFERRCHYFPKTHIVESKYLDYTSSNIFYIQQMFEQLQDLERTYTQPNTTIK